MKCSTSWDCIYLHKHHFFHGVPFLTNGNHKLTFRNCSYSLGFCRNFFLHLAASFSHFIVSKSILLAGYLMHSQKYAAALVVA
uniref:Uncharacterized protein n=1 Tax=Arundo donax TaxID=35708 RepID=A0A0A9E0Z8_ARUDO